MSAFTYLIGWRSLDVWYYGYKTGSTDQLWTTYFTSSELVREHRSLYGEPDVVRIHMMFSNKTEALAYENKFLRRVKAVRSPRWLNRHDNENFQGPSKFSEKSLAKKAATMQRKMDDPEYRKLKSEAAKKAWETKRANGYEGSNKGRKFSDEARANMSKGHKGQVITEEQRKKISASMMGVNKGRKLPPVSKEHRARLSEATKAYWDRKKSLALNTLESQ